MKVKNVVFSGFMAAILMSATGTASAAISVASQGYVDAKVSTATTAVTNLQQTVETNKTDAANATKKVADDLSAYEAENNQTVTDLGTRLTTAEGTIGEHTTAIAGINEELDKMATNETVDDLTTDVSSLKTQVGEGNVADRIAAAVATETSAREDADTALTTRVGTAESDIDKLEAADTEMSDKISANETAISQLETDLATKISAPAACQTQDCVLSINKATNTISWVPLTEPVEDFIGK